MTINLQTALRGGLLGLSLLSFGCQGPDGSQTLTIVGEDPTNVPLAGLTPDEQATFNRGDRLFDHVFRESQGLGPLYRRASCASCHQADSKGPGTVQRMVVVEDDGYTASPDQSALPWGTATRQQLAAGATHGIVVPDGVPNLKTSIRVGPAVFARGYLEAVPDEAILAEAQAQAAAGRVSGHPNTLADGSIGRFGVKARLPDLDAFTADAFQGEMGLTSPTLPDELPNPDGLTDDLMPGIDLSAETVADTASYVRMLAMPRRTGLTDEGKALFQQAGCADCHRPSYPMRADFPVSVLAGAEAPIYSDLLVHDMGVELADGIVDGSATEREWRTAPLIGLRHLRNYLHDGRADTVEDAIELHRGDGSEANGSVDAFDALSPADRQALLDFVGRL